MKIGIPKEIKPQENRVSLPPFYIRDLTELGHQIFVEKGAGIGSGFSDEEYIREGAVILDTHKEIFDKCDLIVKVKEPMESEIPLLRKDLILFTYLHLAGNPELTEKLLKTGIIALAYETVEEEGRLPLLAPMSVIAGRMAPFMGAYFLQKHFGGRGTFIGGSSGIPHGNVVIIGGGTAGLAAAKVASGMGATVTVLEINDCRITYLEDILPKNVSVIKSNRWNIRMMVKEADILIGAVLIPGAKAPRLVSEELVKSMKPGSVIVDIAIDQGGCIETSRPTTHKDPIYIKHGIVHYCVTNMPGAFPRTSTIALTNATLPYIKLIADAEKDWKKLFTISPALKKGLNLFGGKLTNKAVADSLNLEYTDVDELL